MSEGWEWDTGTARRIETGVAAACRTPAYRRAVRLMRIATAAYVLAALAMCARVREDPTVACSIAGALLAIALPLSLLAVAGAKRAAGGARPHDVDGRRHWAGEVMHHLECDTLSLRRPGR